MKGRSRAALALAAALAAGPALLAGAREAAAWAPLDLEVVPRWGELPVRYHIHRKTIPEPLSGVVVAAVEAGFAAWSSPGCTAWQAVHLGDTDAGYDFDDGDNVILWISDRWPDAFGDAEAILAITTPVWGPDDVIDDADMAFNDVGFCWNDSGEGGCVDVQSIATHEGGHFLGLGHTNARDATMLGFYPGGTTMRSLESDDIEGVCALYPIGGTTAASSGGGPGAGPTAAAGGGVEDAGGAGGAAPGAGGGAGEGSGRDGVGEGERGAGCSCAAGGRPRGVGGALLLAMLGASWMCRRGRARFTTQRSRGKRAAMPESSSAAFDAEVAHALRALGVNSADAALDPLGDPAGAARALAADGGAPLLLRAAPELGAPTRDKDTPFGPAPRDPVWLRIERGASVVRIAPLRLAGGEGARSGEGGAGAAGEGAVEPREAVRVEVTTAQRPCCGAATCGRERTLAAAWLALAPKEPSAGRAGAAQRLLVAEAQDLEAARAEALVEAVAAPLAASLRVPLETARATEPPDAIAPRSLPEPAPEPAPPLTAAALSRFALRSEGELLVLRDHASRGPRSSAARNGLIGAALLLGALALWIQVMRSASAGDSGIAIGVGSAAALLSLAGYAFLGVARFSSRYAARSAPVAWFAQGRFVVAPWVSRAGAIDLRPEGRLGAAISAGEVHGIHVVPRGDRFSVELETDHGAIDALLTEREDVARYWRDAMARAVASVRHPGGPSARQRLRARAEAQQAAAAS
ncbi:matrixin family metalloprotease [Sorangium sp. So ce1036]|uniref:matrixin family metalloprotease n=1 Tax=Sorangium sp. So ce1036 TaxID=3133328 RepID=UPI003F10A8E3